MRNFKPHIPDPTLPGDDIDSPDDGIDSLLVAIRLPLDVVPSLVFQQRLAVSRVGLSLGSLFFTFTATQCGGGDGDDQGRFHDGCWFHGVCSWIEGELKKAWLRMGSLIFAGATADRAVLESLAFAQGALRLPIQSGAFAQGAGS